MRKFLCSVFIIFLFAAPVFAVDYAEEGTWISLPETDKTVDCFYLYPTINPSSVDGKMNVPIDDQFHMIAGDTVFNYQASVFASSCNLFAPYYRQACLEALNLPLEEAQKAVDFAYADARSAFLRYLEMSGRPFILAGHSQGAMMMKMLASEFLKDEKLSKRFVAGYLFGIDITEEFMADNPHLKFAEGPEDVGVILTYNSRSPEAVSEDFKGFLTVTTLKDSLTINPINWKRDETYAPASENLGTVFIHKNKDGTYDREDVANFADARIDLKNGLLLVSTVASNDARLIIPGWPLGVYHVADISLFFKNIEKNVHDRINAYFAAGK